MTLGKYFDVFSAVVTRGHSWSFVVTRAHSCSLDADEYAVSLSLNHFSLSN